MNNPHTFSNLRSPGYLGNKPYIGLIMVIIGSLIFLTIAYNLVNNGPLIQWDLPVANWFHNLALNSSPLVINIMVAGYYFGVWGTALIAVILALYFIRKKFWRELVMIIVSMGLSGLIFLFLSHIFMRPRPFLIFNEQIWLNSSNIPGFPSGHTKTILVLCGFLVYLLLPKIKSRLRKNLVILAALLVVLFIGFSRLYVGDHYLSDVIAGYAVGIAWFGLSYTAIESLFQKYHLRKEKLFYEKQREHNKKD